MNGVDASSLFLVEGCADSEADYAPIMLHHDMIFNLDDDDDDDGNDAESCICHTSLNHEIFYDDDDDDGGGGGESNNGDQVCRRCNFCWTDEALFGYVSTEEGEEESRANFSCEGMKGEMGDRLFWETCLAIGYP